MRATSVITVSDRFRSSNALGGCVRDQGSARGPTHMYMYPPGYVPEMWWPTFSSLTEARGVEGTAPTVSRSLAHRLPCSQEGFVFFCQDSDDDTSKDGVTALDFFKDARVCDS